MSPSIYDLGIDKLPPQDRLRLIGEIWDTLEPADLGGIPDWHQEIIDERLAEADANPGEGLTLEEAMARLRGER
jgi:putative addiction module component (TIGR02574 family)